MHIDNPQIEILMRNISLFTNKNLFIAGDLDSAQILHIAKVTANCHIHIDNYNVANEICASLNLSLDNSFNQSVSYKHVHIHFCALEDLKDKLANIDTVLLFLTKAKEQCYKILTTVESLLKKDDDIYIVGHNASGGKSADKIIGTTAKAYKIDSARKCTIFATHYDKGFKEVKDSDLLKVSLNNIELELIQNTNVFAKGRIDAGTHDLINALDKEKLSGKILDSATGSGVIALYLKKRFDCKVTGTDISACALYTADKNAKLNQISDIKLLACNMLDNLPSYDFIVSNPPFHEGVNTSTQKTIAMIKELKEHLNGGGSAYLVFNSHLPYIETLEENFKSVKILSQSPRYTVIKATK